MLIKGCWGGQTIAKACDSQSQWMINEAGQFQAVMMGLCLDASAAPIIVVDVCNGSDSQKFDLTSTVTGICQLH